MSIIIYEQSQVNTKGKINTWNAWLEQKKNILNTQIENKAKGDAQALLKDRWKTKLGPINNVLKQQGTTVESAVEKLIEYIKEGSVEVGMGKDLEKLADLSKLSKLIKSKGIKNYKKFLMIFYGAIKKIYKDNGIDTKDLEKLYWVSNNIDANSASIANALGGIGQIAGAITALSFSQRLLKTLKLDDKAFGAKIEIRDTGDTIGKGKDGKTGFKITTDTMAIIRIPQNDKDKDDYVLTFNFSDKFSSDFKRNLTTTPKRIKLATRSVEHFLKDTDANSRDDYQEILMNYFSYHKLDTSKGMKRTDWTKIKETLPDLKEVIGQEMLLNYFQGSNQKFFNENYNDKIDIMVYGNKLFFPSNIIRSRNKTFGKRSQSWQLATTAAEVRTKWFKNQNKSNKLRWESGHVISQVAKGKEEYVENKIRKISLIYNQFIDLSNYIERV